jgi:hypothetical protein
MAPSGAAANVGSREGDLASTRQSLAVAHARVNSPAPISRQADDMAESPSSIAVRNPKLMKENPYEKPNRSRSFV